MGKHILSAMAALLAVASMACGQQWVAPRVVANRDAWVQPAAAYQPSGRAYAIDDSFAGQAPIGSGFITPQPAGPTYVPGESQLGPLSVGTPNYYQSPPAGSQTFVQPGLAQPSVVAPSWGQEQFCQPACPPGLMTQPCDPYAYYTTPVAPVVSGVGFQRRPYAELEGRIGDNPNSLHGNLFVPFLQQADSFWFADLRGQWDDDDAREYNAGIAWRRLYGDIIVGLYGFYDYRETRFDNEFQGATVGAEALDLNWEARLNWYIPEGGGKPVTALNQLALVNNAIVFQNGVERAYYGFDAEVGRLLWRGGGLYDAEVRGFVGGYYFNNNSAGFNSFGGPRARLEGRLYDLPRLGPGSRLTLGGTVQYDDLRDIQGIASVNLRIPFGAGRAERGGKLSPIERRMLSPIRRDDDIITRTGREFAERALLVGNGMDGLVMENITEVSAGQDLATRVTDGTGAGSNIFVVTGDAASATTAMLSDGQFLGGQFDVRGENTGQVATFGQKYTVTGTNAAADVVRIANNTTLTGLTITGGADGVSGSNVTGFTISNNAVTTTATNGLDLGGTVNGDITGNTFAQTGSDGVEISSYTGGTISGNTATQNAANGFIIGTELSGGTITGNTATLNGDDGFDFDRITGGSITNNTASGNNNDGFEFDDDVTDATITGNTAFVNNVTGGFGGFNFFNENEAAVAADVTINGTTLIQDNTAVLNARDGFAFGDIDGGVISFNTATSNNTGAAGNGGFSVFGITAGTFVGNTATGNTFEGFFFNEISGAGVAVNSNTASGNTGNGFEVDTFTDGTFNLNLSTDNGGFGYLFPASPPVPPASAAGNTGSGNTGGTNTFPP